MSSKNATLPRCLDEVARAYIAHELKLIAARTRSDGSDAPPSLDEIWRRNWRCSLTRSPPTLASRVPARPVPRSLAPESGAGAMMLRFSRLYISTNPNSCAFDKCLSPTLCFHR